MCKKKEENSTVHPIESTMESLLSRMRSLIDTSVVVGEPIRCEDTIIVPISKVTVGFVSGGGEYGKETKYVNPFSAGAGAGYSVSPLGFAVISNNRVKIMKMEKNELYEKIIETVPNIVDIIKDKIK